MPTDAKVGNPKANHPPSQKGKPLGIPKWGWIVGIALGLIIGYMVLKKSGSSSNNTSDTGTGSDSSPLGNPDSASGGGASSGSPTTPILSAQGITNQGTSDPSAVSGQGDSSTSTNPVANPGGIAPSVSQIQAAGIQPQPGSANTQTQESQSGNITTISMPAGSNVHRPGLQM